jgi:hypothetical protein
MTQQELIVQWFRKRNGFATLGEILGAGEPFLYEFRARATELRKKGYVITCDRGKTPSENLYRLYEPKEAA